MENDISSLVHSILSLRANNSDFESWLELTLTALHTHRDYFDSIVLRLPVDADIKRYYTAIISEMLDDKTVNYGRIIIALVFAVHLQQYFDVDLKTEATKIIEDWLRELTMNDDRRRKHRSLRIFSINWL